MLPIAASDGGKNRGLVAGGEAESDGLQQGQKGGNGAIAYTPMINHPKSVVACMHM